MDSVASHPLIRFLSIEPDYGVGYVFFYIGRLEINYFYCEAVFADRKWVVQRPTSSHHFSTAFEAIHFAASCQPSLESLIWLARLDEYRRIHPKADNVQ